VVPQGGIGKRSVKGSSQGQLGGDPVDLSTRGELVQSIKGEGSGPSTPEEIDWVANAEISSCPSLKKEIPASLAAEAKNVGRSSFVRIVRDIGFV